MTPPISKDWWLAAAMSAATLPSAMAQDTANAQPTTGVVTAVAPDGQVTGNGQRMVAGSNILPGQRLRTDDKGVLHVLFLDQSAITLGPDSELSIDEFQFDPASRQGSIRLNLHRGLVRVVGGQISKHTATSVSTAHGQVEILGGITMVQSGAEQTQASFLFGQQMSAIDNAGNRQTITRAGFAATLAAGLPVVEPARLPSNDLSSMLGRLEPWTPAPQSAALAASGATLPLSSEAAAVSPAQVANDRLNSTPVQNAAQGLSQTLQSLLGSGQLTIQS